MNDSVYGELVANSVAEGKDFGYVPAEAEASVIGRGERLQCGPGDRAERSADKDRGQFAAVVTEHEPQYGGNSPDSGHRPRSGEQNR